MQAFQAFSLLQTFPTTKFYLFYDFQSSKRKKVLSTISKSIQRMFASDFTSKKCENKTTAQQSCYESLPALYFFL